MYETITIDTPPDESLTDITATVRAIVKSSSVLSGVCFVIVPHTTAGVTVNSAVDPETLRDILEEVRRVVPTRTDFHHVVDSPSDAAAHIRTSLMRSSETLLIEEGDLALGRSQAILLCEFDGPRRRTVMVKVIEG